MVNSRRQRLDETFFALSDPTRRAILARLAQGDCSVAELAEPFDVSSPAISKHLRVLQKAGLVTQRREGRVRRCHFESEPLYEASAWVEQHRRFWTGQLDRLEAFLDGVQSDEKTLQKQKKGT